MGGVVTEEQAISQDRYLDLVYSQYGTLFYLIPQDPRPNTDTAKPPVETPVNGIVGSIQPFSVAKPAKKPNASATTPSTPKVSTEVNVIQSTQTPNNNKNKGKEKNKLETNKRTLNLQPMKMIKGREKKNIHVYYAKVTISQKSVPIGMKSPNL